MPSMTYVGSIILSILFVHSRKTWPSDQAHDDYGDGHVHACRYEHDGDSRLSLLRDFRYGFASQTCLYQPTKKFGELSDVLVDACLLQ